MVLLRKTILLFLCFLFLSHQLIAQENEKEEIVQCPIIGFSLGYTFPKGDFGKNFDPFMQAGANFLFKTKKNWVFGVEGNFISGNDNLKDDARKEILKDLYTSSGFIMGTNKIVNNIDQYTVDAGITAHNRGFNTLLRAGKIIPLSKKNPNSGIFLMGGVGITQGQIIYKTNIDEATQLMGDYARGYDRKNRGFQLTEFVGYWFMSNSSRYLNFYIGLECGQSWSKSVRKYQFDLDSRGKDSQTYTDRAYTLKMGWMFPIGSKKATDFYFN